MTRQTILTLLALAAAAIVAGCASSAPSTPSANSPIAASTGQPEENKPPADSPYSQPLMATGGDLVMLRMAPRGIAG
jgi:hypothetical protein